jgi:di/tricarboxylate transporter
MWLGKKAVKLLAVVASVLIAYFLASPLEEKMRVTLTLLFFASGLWITELLPMGITAIFVLLILVLLFRLFPVEATIVQKPEKKTGSELCSLK